MQSHRQGYQDYIFNSQQPILNVSHIELCSAIELYRFILLLKAKSWRIIFDRHDSHFAFCFFTSKFSAGFCLLLHWRLCL